MMEEERATGKPSGEGLQGLRVHLLTQQDVSEGVPGRLQRAALFPETAASYSIVETPPNLADRDFVIYDICLWKRPRAAEHRACWRWNAGSRWPRC